ncbi:MAG: B12-binding domain-containing radical SAM protein [Candidatus Eremiobacteraeota bacterium]|nr:B12-binding domain-containing radical SAM protein [Candidatus Eremiobacteraeota bacterium]
MKIFLIQPNAKATFETPPLGLRLIATVLKSNNYNNIYDIDQNKGDRPYSLDYTGDNVIVGISVTFMTIIESFELAGLIKSKNPDATIILGGPHATLMPGECISDENIDLIALGEGEFTMLEVVKTIEKSGTFEGIKGIWYKDEKGETIKNERRDYLKDLDTLPISDREFFNDRLYQKDNLVPCWNLITSQSCPFSCAMCQPALRKIAGPWRQRSVGSVITEIKYLKKKYNSIYLNFNDNDMGVDKKWLREFCEEVKKIDNISMTCCGRANLLDYDMLKIMKEAGFNNISFGAESGNDRVLCEIMNKKTTVQQIKDFAHNCYELKINCHAYWMLANPGETIEEMKDTVKLSSELPLYYSHFHIANPNPGTKYYLDALSGGYLKLNNWNDVDDRSNPTIIKDNVTVEQIREMDKYLIKVMEEKGWRHFYNGHTLHFTNDKYLLRSPPIENFFSKVKLSLKNPRVAIKIILGKLRKLVRK